MGRLSISPRFDQLAGDSGVDLSLYQLRSEKDAPNGYPSLNVSGVVPRSELGSGTPSTTTFLRGDSTWAAPDHAFLSNVAWTLSGHTGTANRVAGFGVDGAAAYFQVGVDLQAYDAGLQSLSSFPTVADRYLYSTAADTWAEGTITSFARTILDDTDGASVRATIGAGNVVGPASAQDNGVVRFDLTTGRLIQDSTVVISDTGNFTVSGLSGSTHNFTISSTNTALEIRGNRSAGNTTADVIVRGQATRGLTTPLFEVQNNSTTVWRVRGDGAMLPAQNAWSSGIVQAIVTGGVNPTGQTASTEAPFWHAATYTRTWAAGAISDQREVRIDAPTYAFASASTITRAATLYVGAAPIAGTNATITNAYALWVDDGTVRLDGALQVTNTGLQLYDTNASHFLTIAPGSDLTAARTLTLTTGDASRTLNITGAQGAIYYTDASGNVVPLAAGTSGQFLSTQGAGANPQWKDLVASNGIVVRTAVGAYSPRTITGTANQISVTNGDGVSGDPTLALANNPVLPGTGGVIVPTGTTAQRPTATAGTIRWNSTIGAPEISDGTTWHVFSGSVAAKQSEGLRNQVRFHDHFLSPPIISTTTTTVGPMLLSASGTGATATGQATADAARPGQIRLTTGTTTTGRSAIHHVQNTVRLGGGVWTIGWGALPTTLSTGTDRYQLFIGLIDNPAAANQADAVYFLYDEGGVSTGSAASANWQCVTTKGSVRTFTTTSVAVSTTTWADLEIRLNAAGTSVDFLINGTVVATHTTNIPTSASELCTPGAGILKSAGTNARTVDLDYVAVYAELT